MSRARRPQRRRRHRGQRPERQRRTGEAGKFDSAAAARRPALVPAGEIFPADRLAAAPAGSRALRDMPGTGLRKPRQGIGRRISEASEPASTGGAAGCWPRLKDQARQSRVSRDRHQGERAARDPGPQMKPSRGGEPRPISADGRSIGQSTTLGVPADGSRAGAQDRQKVGY